METPVMGRVLVDATVESLEDLWEAKRGLRAAGDVRRLELVDALVDTGATTLSLPSRMMHQLGLSKRAEKRVITGAGLARAGLYDAVRLTIAQRDCTVDVVEVPDESPVLIGQIPLEMLDFVVDPRNRRLIGNPAHGGEHVIEVL
jgi:predicted aspartyl protease